MCIEYQDIYECDRYRACMTSDAPQVFPCGRCRYNTNAPEVY